MKLDGLKKQMDFLIETAYKRGCEDEQMEAKPKETRAFNDGYEIGMEKAWECARWIVGLCDYEVLERLFGDSRVDEIIISRSVKEAMRKIKEFEEESKPKEQKPRKGHWIEKRNAYGEITRWHCSNCYDDSGFTTTRKWDFCPNCGADMRGDEE